jgi:glycosyltransferase involved in cell wall biosynthesis
MSHVSLNILVSGWRSIPHSYAIINQFQCLELIGRPNVKLYFRDVPYFRRKWSPASLLTNEQEQAIRAIPPLPENFVPDVEYRIAFPYDLTTPTSAKRLFVYGTAEYHCVPNDYLVGGVPLAEAQGDAVIVTCSNWSRDGFIRSGASADRVVIVPNGFDPSLFRPPTSDERAAARTSLGLAPDEFIFLSLGNMAGSKGMGLLMHTFAQVLKRGVNARLVLKGLDAVYSSTKFLDGSFQQVAEQDRALLGPKLSYTGQSLPFAEMPRLFHAADCYVSPYHAEGFNMPVLEAAACGLPVICTAGGSTDDFTNGEFALRIESQLSDTPGPQGPFAQTLMPSAQSLFDQMMRVIADIDFRRRAAVAGPALASAKFTWRHVTDRLLAVLASN